MRWKRQSKAFSAAEVVALAVLAGIALLMAVYWTCTRSARSNGERMLEETLEFMKQQCLRYDNLSASEEIKDQMLLLDKTRELARCLGEMQESEYAKFLKNYAEGQRISGIVLMNREQQMVAGVFQGDDRYEDWETELKDKNIQNVMDYSEKTYVSRLRKADGHVYDYAVVGMADSKGMVFCYMRQIQNAAGDNQLRIENIFSGYHMEMDGLILITDGETILSSNNEALHGRSTSDYPLLADHGSEILSDGSCTLYQNGINYLARSGKCREYYLYAFFPEREVYRQRSVKMAFVFIGYVLFLLLLAVMMQREIKRSNQLKMKFLRQMCHDIRTPINGIRGMIRIGNCYPEDMERQRECREKIWKASGLLMDLINDVLDMGKLESGEIILEEKPFNLSELLSDIVTVMESQAADQHVSLVIDRMEGVHWNLIGSPVHLRRMLTNIISNAIKYNKKGGSVTISCIEQNSQSEKGPASFELICADTGIGMSREFQKRMFEQFTQEKTSDEAAHHGTGLGLAIVKNLVLEMKGSIRCESETGKGTVFYITIPLEIDNAPELCETGEANEKEPVSGQMQNVSVLLVEDNDLNMEVAEFILEEEGVIVTKAWNGQEAIQIFEESDPGQFQIILMDMMMPVMDGRTAVRKIRALDRDDARTVPIIAMTANAFESDIRSALQAGMNAHVSKPVAPEHLITVMKHCLKLSSA